MSRGVQGDVFKFVYLFIKMHTWPARKHTKSLMSRSRYSMVTTIVVFHCMKKFSISTLVKLLSSHFFSICSFQKPKMFIPKLFWNVDSYENQIHWET